MIILSVVIGVRNRDKHLNNCLYSLTRQSIPPEKFEVIVVDYGGTSNTKEIVESFAKKNFTYIYVNQTGVFNESRSKNIGIRESRGAYILCTNADIIFSKYSLEDLITKTKSLKEPSLITKKRIELDEKFIFSQKRLIELISKKNINQNVLIGPSSAVGDFQATSKSDFEKVCGYDERMIGWGGMDNDLSERLNKIGLKTIWLNERKNPIYHQYHDWKKDRKPTDHNLNQMLKKCHVPYKPLHWGKKESQKKVLLLLENKQSYFVNDANDIKDIGKKYRLNLILRHANETFGDENHSFFVAGSFDGIISTIGLKNIKLDTVIKDTLKLVNADRDIVYAYNKSLKSYATYFNGRSYLILNNTINRFLQKLVQINIIDIIRKYDMSYERVENNTLQVRSVNYVSNTLNRIMWSHEVRKKLI